MEKCPNKFNRTISTDFDNDVRYIDVTIKVYFDDEPLVIDRDNYLISFDILEELHGEDNNLYGSLSSNEFNFELYNDNDIFTPTNEASEYFGKIETNTKVEIFIREEISNSKQIFLGTYFVTDWKCNQSSNTVSVTCNDRLYSLMKSKNINTKLMTDISVYEFLTYIFTQLNLTLDDFSIEDNLKSKYIKHAYILDGEISNTLNEIIKAYYLYIYVDRYNKIQVHSVTSISDSLITLTEYNQILDCNIEKTLLSSYSTVEVEYTINEIKLEQTILSTSNNISKGLNDINDINRNDKIVDIDYINIESSNDNVSLERVTFTSNEIGVIVNNKSSENQDITTTIVGSTLSTSLTDAVIIENDVLVKRMGYKPLSVTSSFINTRQQAIDISQLLNNYIMDTNPYITLVIRGNPELQLFDVITVQSEVDKINSDMIIVKQEYIFNDSLECVMTCINSNVVKGGI